MRCEHRLRSLKVRVTRDHQIVMPLGIGEKCSLHFEQPQIDDIDRRARPELDVGDDLVIAAAPGVQLATDIAEPFDECLLDVRMDVLELHRVLEFAAFDLALDFGQGGDDQVGLIARQQADVGEHARMCLAGGDVFAVEALVEADRFGEAFDAVIGVAGEASAPGFLRGHGILYYLFAARIVAAQAASSGRNRGFGLPRYK